MPVVTIRITAGATREQKSQLVRDVTDSLVRVLGKKPEHTHVVIEEVAGVELGLRGDADRRLEGVTGGVSQRP